MSNCPCGSKKEYSLCCGPFLDGDKNPEEAVQLMRSRYTAYVKKDIFYIFDTHLPEARGTLSLESLANWISSSNWLDLTILSTEKGKPGDDYGIVDFKAAYLHKGKKEIHHEISSFVKKDGKWYYETYLDENKKERDGLKIGRNDPCHCNSGKKYKKCCFPH